MKRKVFGIGLSRTGTTSLTQALRLLKYISVHFPHDGRTQEELMAYWANPTRPFELTVAREYDAVTDTPVAAVFRELAARWPDSRFVLTVRDETSWLASCAQAWAGPVAGQYAQGNAFAAYCRALNRACYGIETFDAHHFRQASQRHTQAVQQAFAHEPARLLVFDLFAGHGWNELCAFLGHAVPERPFPHLNAG